MKETKWVSLKNAKKGDKIHSIRRDNSYTMAEWTVIEVCDAFVKLALWNNPDQIETWSTEDAYYEVELTKQEFRAKYKEEATKIYPLLLHPLTTINPYWEHSMDNSWCELLDIYEFAAALKQANLYFMGWFKLDTPRVLFDNSELDIGVVAKDRNTDNIIWCHASSDWIEDMKDYFFLD